VITNDDLPRPKPAAEQLLVRVKTLDALTRERRLYQPLPLILGCELSGIVEGIGADAGEFRVDPGKWIWMARAPKGICRCDLGPTRNRK
jgi:NADPH:quinone reductase-like Zn-dependent oxidoreductase